MREVLNAIFYPARSGCAWRLLPPDFPAAVYGYFISWPKTALWQAVNEVLRSAAYTPEEQLFIDSQTIKTTKAALDGPGFDGAKLITGRKGFIRVDVLGMLLAVFVSKGNVCRPRRHPTLA